MVIIETSVFTRRIKEVVSDDANKDLPEALVNRPDMGAIIQGTGGLRKVRWKLEGRGKSGGIRAINYRVTADEHIYMLLAYPKNEQGNLTPEQKKALKMVARDFMTRTVVSCQEANTLEEIMGMMNQGRFRHVPRVMRAGPDRVTEPLRTSAARTGRACKTPPRAPR